MVILDCFKGDLAILFHLCKTNEIDALELVLYDILQKYLPGQNCSLLERCFFLVVFSYLLEHKSYKALGFCRHSDLADSVEDWEIALKFNIKSHFQSWLSSAVQGLMSRVSVFQNNRHPKVSTSKELTISPSRLFNVAKSLLEQKSSYQSYFGLFISFLRDKVKQVVDYKNKLIDLLKKRQKVKLKQYTGNRLDAVCMFLAALELAKDGHINLSQVGNDILITQAYQAVKDAIGAGAR